jgi:hypothetical protein
VAGLRQGCDIVTNNRATSTLGHGFLKINMLGKKIADGRAS